MPAKQYDVLVYGASSFVGRLLCQYLDSHFNQLDGEKLNWLIAGRDESKLAQLSQELGYQPRYRVVDAMDEAGLLTAFADTKVVVSCAGPYALYGELVLKACIDNGVDYCDLCGEVQWIKAMQDKYQTQAEASGSRIVNCCGFDSLPSDLGVYYTQKMALQTFGRYSKKISMRVRALRGSASGGTIASMVNIAREASTDKKVRRLLANPYALCDEQGLTSPALQQTAQYDITFMRWTAPFVMAAINTPIVLRSNELQAFPYGHDFCYDEAIISGKGWRGWMKASSLAATLGTFFVAAGIKPSREVLEKYLLPKPGTGPSDQAQKSGFFDIRFCAFDQSGKQMRVKVTGQGDPGYASTSKMLGQACASIALDFHADKNKTGATGGFCTPASFFGDALIARLQSHADIVFELMP